MTERIIGSFECIKSRKYAQNLAGTLRRTYMLEVYVLKDVNEEWTVVYYLKDSKTAKDAFNVYLKYEQGEGAPSSITLKEHRFLGECFGLDKESIDWFIEEMEEEGVK